MHTAELKAQKAAELKHTMIPSPWGGWYDPAQYRRPAMRFCSRSPKRCSRQSQFVDQEAEDDAKKKAEVNKEAEVDAKKIHKDAGTKIAEWFHAKKKAEDNAKKKAEDNTKKSIKMRSGAASTMKCSNPRCKVCGHLRVSSGLRQDVEAVAQSR